MKIIIVDNLSDTTDPGKILPNLHKSESNKTKNECLEYLENLKLPRISDTEKVFCEETLTKPECWEALSFVY